MWDFFETVRHRHSIRQYQTDMPVEPEKLHAILETACSAPSAGDLQAYRIIVVRNQEKRKTLSQDAGQPFIAEAPVCLVFCADPERSGAEYGDRGRSLYAVQDATIATAYTQLAIVAAGLGSTWVGFFDEEKVRSTLGIQPSLSPIAMLSIGYPAELPEPTSRRKMTDLISYTD